MSYRRQTRGEIIIYHSSVGSESISLFLNFFRYLSRVVLVPFAYQPPSVSADTLDELLRKACAALPQAIVIGSTLMGLSGDIFKQVAAQIESTLTASLLTADWRCSMPYQLSVHTCYTVSSQ